MDDVKITLNLIERFAVKWQHNKDNGCWEWTASADSKGYGSIKIPKTRKQIRAHRLSYLLHRGKIPEGMLVCHTCDNPKCVKPSHLFLGTHADNSQDMVAKGRDLRGSKQFMAKLTAGEVREIHYLYAKGDVSYAKLGKKFKVSTGTIQKIVMGLRWKHIKTDAAGEDIAVWKPKHSNTKLDEDKVMAMLELNEQDIPVAQIARTFGVVLATAQRIIKGLRWKDVYQKFHRGY